MPGASLWHRKWHVPGHCTASIRRSQTHHFSFIEGKSYQSRKLKREKNIMCDWAISPNWMQISTRPIAILNLPELGILTGPICYSLQLNALQVPLKSHLCECIIVGYEPSMKKRHQFEEIGCWIISNKKIAGRINTEQKGTIQSNIQYGGKSDTWVMQ